MKKSEWTNKIVPLPPKWKMSHFYLSFLASVLKSVPRYLWARCTDICLGKLIERVLAPAWRSLSTQTEWHTGTQMDLQKSKGWNTCFLIRLLYLLQKDWSDVKINHPISCTFQIEEKPGSLPFICNIGMLREKELHKVFANKIPSKYEQVSPFNLEFGLSEGWWMNRCIPSGI